MLLEQVERIPFWLLKVQLPRPGPMENREYRQGTSQIEALISKHREQITGDRACGQKFPLLFAIYDLPTAILLKMQIEWPTAIEEYHEVSTEIAKAYVVIDGVNETKRSKRDQPAHDPRADRKEPAGEAGARGRPRCQRRPQGCLEQPRNLMATVLMVAGLFRR
jgi:hypothetical protein